MLELEKDTGIRWGRCVCLMFLLLLLTFGSVFINGIALL